MLETGLASYSFQGKLSLQLSVAVVLLLAALMDAARSAGFRRMIAVIGDSGNAGSIRLHAAAGFRHVGLMEKVGYKFGRELDVVFMQRELG